MRHTDVTDSELLAYLAGSLEPDRRYELRALLSATPDLRQRFRALKRTWRPLQEDALRPWRMPPPGYQGGKRPFQIGEAASFALGEEGSFRVGDRMVLPVLGVADPHVMRVVLLQESQDGWTVLFPVDRDSEITVGDLPTDADGVPQLELHAPPPVGRQRLALALAPAGLEIDWSGGPELRWEPLRRGIATGDVSVATWVIHVNMAE